MSTPEARFVELLKTWLVSLPHDLKIAFEAMDDENLPRSSREIAVGAIMYVVSPNDFVSDRNEAVASFADDALLLRLALQQVAETAAEEGDVYRERFPDLFDGLAEGDYIEFGTLGAYGLATATRFNGYGEHRIVSVERVLEM